MVYTVMGAVFELPTRGIPVTYPRDTHINKHISRCDLWCVTKCGWNIRLHEHTQHVVALLDLLDRFLTQFFFQCHFHIIEINLYKITLICYFPTKQGPRWQSHPLVITGDGQFRLIWNLLGFICMSVQPPNLWPQPQDAPFVASIAILSENFECKV